MARPKLLATSLECIEICDLSFMFISFVLFPQPVVYAVKQWRLLLLVSSPRESGSEREACLRRTGVLLIWVLGLHAGSLHIAGVGG